MPLGALGDRVVRHSVHDLHRAHDASTLGLSQDGIAGRLPWCEENGRKPFAKSAFKEKLEFNLQLGIKLATLDGYEIFRGIRMKPDLTAESDLDGPSVPAPVSDQPADF